MALTFNSAKAFYDGTRDIVRFSATDGNKNVPCAVSEEALMDLCGMRTASPEELVDAYRSNQNSIHNIARKKYEAGILDPSGMVLVKTADLNR